MAAMGRMALEIVLAQTLAISRESASDLEAMRERQAESRRQIALARIEIDESRRLLRRAP